MSTLKVDTLDTSNGTGNITLSRPIVGDGSGLTSLPAANLTGTIAGARLPDPLPAISGASLTGVAPTKATVEALGIDLPAANLTGTIANARISAGSVTQHVTATDLTPVHQSIATLGLHMGVSANAAAFNLPNAFIDTFEDDTGITTETDVDRDTIGEFVSSITLSAFSTIWGPVSSGGSQGNGFNNYSFRHIISSISTGTWSRIRITVTSGISSTGSINNASIGIRTGSDFDTTTTPTEVLWGGTSGSTGADQVSDELVFTLNGGTEYIFCADMDDTYYTYRFTGNIPTNSKVSYENSNYGYDVSDAYDGSAKYDASNFIKEIEGRQATVSATGTLISDTQTAPAATTEVSGVILYKDNAGTNTLGTDLKIYFTADNGSNWTEAASYGTAQTFSGTTKQVKLGKTTVTSGTAIAMKAVWANQAATVSGGYDSGDRTSTITVTTDQSVGSGAITNLVDGATSNGCYFSPNGFAVTGKYIRFQFSSAKVITETTFYHQGHTGEHLGTWKWQGSNNGSSWTDISDDYILCNAQTSQEITAMSLSSVTNSTAYTYYQLLGVSGTGNSEWINEMTFKEAGVTGKEAQLHGWAVNY